MKKINLRDYYPYYTQDMIVEVPDEVALLLREYMLLEEAYRIRTYRYKAFYSLDRDEGIEREILQKPLNPAEIWEQLARYRAMEKDAKTLAQDHVLTVELIERLIERIEIDHERNIHVTFRFKNEFQGKAVEPCATM